MVPVCDNLNYIYNRFRHFWAEIKKLWNYPLEAALTNIINYLKLYSYIIELSENDCGIFIFSGLSLEFIKVTINIKLYDSFMSLLIV